MRKRNHLGKGELITVFNNPDITPRIGAREVIRRKPWERKGIWQSQVDRLNTAASVPGRERAQMVARDCFWPVSQRLKTARRDNRNYALAAAHDDSQEQYLGRRHLIDQLAEMLRFSRKGAVLGILAAEQEIVDGAAEIAARVDQWLEKDGQAEGTTAWREFSALMPDPDLRAGLLVQEARELAHRRTGYLHQMRALLVTASRALNDEVESHTTHMLIKREYRSIKRMYWKLVFNAKCRGGHGIILMVNPYGLLQPMFHHQTGLATRDLRRWLNSSNPKRAEAAYDKVKQSFQDLLTLTMAQAVLENSDFEDLEGGHENQVRWAFSSTFLPDAAQLMSDMQREMEEEPSRKTIKEWIDFLASQLPDLPRSQDQKPTPLRHALLLETRRNLKESEKELRSPELREIQEDGMGPGEFELTGAGKLDEALDKAIMHLALLQDNNLEQVLEKTAETGRWRAYMDSTLAYSQ